MLFFIFLFVVFVQPVLADEANPDVQKIILNDISVVAMNDSTLTFTTEVFADIDKYPERKAMMPNGQFDTITRTYLVQIGNSLVLIDTGHGEGELLEKKGQTKELLLKQNIQPTEVTDILLTHMDIDHVSGLIYQNKAVYPNATLWIAKIEYDDWIINRPVDRPAEHIALVKKVARIYKEHIKLFKHGETILPGIVAISTQGHTAGHTSYEISSGNKGLMIVGDIMHIEPIQSRFTDYNTIYDMDPVTAASTRERILNKLSQEDRLILGMHFPQIGKVQSSPNGGYTIKTTEPIGHRD